MKHMFMSCLILLVAGAALAGGPPVVPDVIGVYLDEDATYDCVEQVSGAFPAYVVLTEMTSPGVLGWEAKISHEGGIMVIAETLRGQALNVGWREFEYVVGLAAPIMATGGTAVVMEMTLFVMDDSVPSEWYIGPVYFHTCDEPLPCYLDAYDAMDVRPLIPSSEDVEKPVFETNVDCRGTIPTDTRAWGEVKSLFR